MKKISRIILPVLLLLLTVLTVAAPRIVSAVTDIRLLGEKEEWDYSRSDSSEISEAQVAELYRTGQLNIYYPPMYNTQKYDTKYLSKVPESVYRLLENLFGEESETYAYLKEIFSLGDFSGSQKKSIIVIDDRPVALNTVTAHIEDGNGTFIDVTYEERTLTLARLFIQYPYSVLYGTSPFDVTVFETALREYSEKVILLAEDEYSFFNEIYMLYGIKHGHIQYGLVVTEIESDYDLK